MLEDLLKNISALLGIILLQFIILKYVTPVGLQAMILAHPLIHSILVQINTLIDSGRFMKTYPEHHR